MVESYHFKVIKYGKRMKMSIGEYNLSERFGAHGLLHTPEGVRDIYNSECQRKLTVQQNIHSVLELYQFKDIQTPTFEYFDIFNKERGTIASKEMYKFFDKEGNTLVLRPDITPSIARCAAKYFKEEEQQIRLCYVGNTFINNSRYQGKLKETTQVGAELINDDSVDADAELLALTIECLLKSGLTDFQLEVGHADFLTGILEEATFNEEETTELKNLIEQKNLFGVEELLESKELDPELAEVILKIPELFGGVENLEFAKQRVKNERSLQAIERLETLSDILRVYGLVNYITFDLGMLSKYNYYTGIIFRAYTYGTGDVIATGGRYDNLVVQFGKRAPAIGFAIVIDQLMLALDRQKIQIDVPKNNTMILYVAKAREVAIKLGQQFRRDGMSIELLCKSEIYTVEDYIEYGKRNNNGGILFVKSSEDIDVITIATGESISVSVNELIHK